MNSDKSPLTYENDKLAREADAKALADKQAQDAITAAQATPVPAPVIAQPVPATVAVRQVVQPLFQDTAETTCENNINATRNKLNREIDRLNDTQLKRVLVFVETINKAAA